MGSAFNPFQYQPAPLKIAESSSDSSPSVSDHTPAKEEPCSLSKLPPDEEQLFAHYINVVSHILASTPEKQGLHRLDLAIRKFSRDYYYLYKIALAFSALHLATQSKDVGVRHILLDVALQHQNLALERFRPILNDIHAENCEPALACASLIMFCTLAVPVAAPDVDPNRMEQLKRVMALFDGIVKLYRMGWMTNSNSYISSYIRDRVVTLWSAERDAPEAEASLDLLAHKAVMALGNADARDMYFMAIEKMKRTHRRLVDVQDDMEVVLFFPGMVPPQFYYALEAHEPIALVVLAHWAVCLHHCRHFFWVGSNPGWGKWTIDTVAKTLDESWHPFLEWPLRQVA